MCGICGTTENNREKIAVMTDALAHRGPDGADIFEREGVTLGHRRLAIIDLDQRAAQPMTSADGRYIVTYNGELYNYQELKRELTDYPFKTESDTEVLLAAYARWGEGMFPKLRGIFAFGIWDRKERTLFLARDHMGVKPLYYAHENGVLTFASELSVFAKTHRALDPEAVSLYLSLMYVSGPMTMLQGVSKLPPGHLLRWQNGSIELREYFNAFTGDGVKPEDGIYETIDTAVERQLVSDRPIGVFLSGGLDSSIVLHHMSRHTDNVRSFSVDFEMVAGAGKETEERFNTDAVLAKRTAEHYGAKHTTYTISLQDVRDSLTMVAESLDEPVANATGLSQYLLSRWVREDGVVVALGGDGGDELFGGYTRHRAMMAAYWYQRLPRLAQWLGAALHPRAKKLMLPIGPALHTELMATEDALVGRITREVFSGEERATAYFRALYERAPKNMHPLDVFMRVDRRTWLPEESLARSDRTSMAHGLELRVPLLDVDVVRLADAVSVFKKTTPWSGKNVLRTTYREHLPEYLFDQPKRGWISPSAKWFRDEQINATLEAVFSSEYYDGLDDLFDWDAVRRMLREHTHEGGYYRQPLWNVLTLQAWARKHNLRYE